jgi:hypothetical protein
MSYIKGYALIFAFKTGITGEARWLRPVILATQEAEIGRVKVGVQPCDEGNFVHVPIHTCHSSYTGSILGGSWSKPAWAKP